MSIGWPLINLLKELQDFLLVDGDGVGGHIHCVSGSIKGNSLQLAFGNAENIQAHRNIKFLIELKQAFRQIIRAIE